MTSSDDVHDSGIIVGGRRNECSAEAGILKQGLDEHSDFPAFKSSYGVHTHV